VKYGFAHRGGAHGPENTLPTFVDALARGARGLETDAWLTLDGTVVLDHDGLASRRPRQLIADVEHHRLDHLTTLGQLYDRCGTDFELAVDVKNGAIAVGLVETARRYDAADRLWVVIPHTAAHELAVVEQVHRVVTVRANVLRSPQRKRVLATASELGVAAINARWMWWTRSLVAEVHALGMLAFGYDAQRTRSLRRCAEIGLDGVFSDHVDRMLAVTGG
jgi:glycerophosphoryl diester phosphodiesterase